jgi:ribosomal protein L11 methyltransferase
MQYIKVTFTISGQEIQEVLAAMTEQLGFEGFEFTDDVLHAFIPEIQFSEQELQELLKGVPDFKDITYETEVIPETNWNDLWEKGYSPVIIGNDINIRATFHPADTGARYEVIIDPKMSFGTGHHETTWMMAETMLHDNFQGKKVLDFGSGTGILAILASKMGAEKVVAIDHEEWAYNNSLENLELNAVSNIDVIHGDETAIPSTTFDIVLANVNKNVILGNLHRLTEVTIAKGFIYLSGLLEEDEAPVLAAAAPFGLQLLERRGRNRWICLKLIKNV